MNGKRFRRNADLRERAVAFQQGEVGVDVMLRGHGVEDEMKTAGLFFHFVFVLGVDDFVRAQSQSVLHLVRRGGENHDVRAKRLRQFHAHVTETPQSHDADLLALGNFVMAQRRISRDAGAEQGSGRCEIQMLFGIRCSAKGFIHDEAGPNNHRTSGQPEMFVFGAL